MYKHIRTKHHTHKILIAVHNAMSNFEDFKHSDAKRMWDEEYDFEVKHRNIKFEERSARDSWERKRRKAANKIARLKREIKGLESDVGAYSLPRDSYQHRLDEAELHEDYLRRMFNETN